MSILDRYIGAAAARSYLLVNLLLLGLFGFFDLSMQLEDVGKGSYATTDALLFTLYQIPRRLVDLTPFSALMAAVLTLGGLAASSELLVMRSAGMPPLRITLGLLKSGIILLAGVVALEMYVAPPLQQQAFQMRAAEIAGGAGDAASSLWVRSGEGVIHIGSLLHGRIPADISIYRFDDGERLRFYIHAGHADILGHDQWRLYDVTRKNFTAGREVSEQLDTFDWRPELSAAQLSILDQPADSLSPLDLHRYITYLQHRGQNAESFRVALWQKLAMPLTAIAMILLAAPLSFFNPRGTNMGVRVVAGSAIGIGVYSVTQVIANLTLLLNLNPVLTALAPAGICTLLALYLLKRVT